MVIRPVAVAYGMGETGRPAGKHGGKGGPTAFLDVPRDSVLLNAEPGRGAGLYTASPLFKMTGVVELMSGEHDGAAGAFGNRPVLI